MLKLIHAFGVSHTLLWGNLLIAMVATGMILISLSKSENHQLSVTLGN